MKEHSIFISYRKDDGEDLAKWIHENLRGRSHKIKTLTGSEIVMLTTQLDSASASGSNWKKDFIDEELEYAKSICIVCSPAAMISKSVGEDYLDYEISWWIKNRRTFPPILVAPKKYTCNYIPNKINESWSNPQISVFDKNNTENFIESLTRGITHSIDYIEKISNTSTSKLTEIPILQGFYYWEKDRFGRYILASELYARAAGFDSPHAMIGKTDFDMPWRSLAKYFQEGDRKIMNTNEISRVFVLEKEIMVDKVADILVHENVLRDHSNRIIGVTGFFIDVTGKDLPKNSIKYMIDDTGLNLGEEFDNQRLNIEEVRVFQGLVRNKSIEMIAKELNLNVDVVESVTLSLQKKLQGSNNQDIIVIAVRSGLPLKLFGLD